MRAPIFIVGRNGDVSAHTSVADAESAVESVDVEDGEYLAAYDADGRLLRHSASRRQPNAPGSLASLESSLRPSCFGLLISHHPTRAASGGAHGEPSKTGHLDLGHDATGWTDRFFR